MVIWSNKINAFRIAEHNARGNTSSLIGVSEKMIINVSDEYSR
jgi:hypothetical protein